MAQIKTAAREKKRKKKKTTTKEKGRQMERLDGINSLFAGSLKKGQKD